MALKGSIAEWLDENQFDTAYVNLEYAIQAVEDAAEMVGLTQSHIAQLQIAIDRLEEITQ